METKQPKVAVLLAAYNGMHWIAEQTKSILEQKHVNVELFISIDLSDDCTYEWCKQLESDNHNVTVLPYGERFGGAGANFYRLIRDVDFTGFDVVAFADQDDVWFGDKLWRAWSKISSDECDIYSSNVIAFWTDGRERLIVKSQPQRALDHFFEAAGPGCTYVFSQEAMIDFQKFVRNLNEKSRAISLHDWLAYAFCRERGYRWLIDEKPSMRYRQHSNNQVGTNTGLTAYYKRWQLIKQRWFHANVNAIVEMVAPCRVTKLNKPSYLLLNANKLRRRFRDRCVLFLLVLFRLY